MKQSSVSAGNTQEQNPLLSTYNKTSKSNSQQTYVKILLPPDSIIKISQISCGLDFTVLLTTNMQLYSFGDNQYGQLGYSNDLYPRNMEEPRLIKFNHSSTKFVSVTGVRCGFSHAVAFNQKEAYGWGQCQYGALGFQPHQLVNQWMPRKLPILISNHQELLDISCGNNTTVFNISNDFYGIGDNRQGQLGLILKKPTTQPQKITLNLLKYPSKRGNKLVQVKAGDKFTVGIDQGGNLYGAGQFIKFGLHLRTHNALPLGLSPIQQLTNSGYDLVTNVKDFWCGEDLLIRSNMNYLVYYGKNKKSTLKIDNIKRMSIIGLSNNKAFLKKQQQIYQWNINQKCYKNSYLDVDQHIQEDSIQLLNKIFQEQQYQQINMQVNGSIVYIPHNYQKQQYILQRNSKRKDKNTNIQNQKHQTRRKNIEQKSPQSQNRAKLSKNSNIYLQQQVKQLKKQIYQQKQIIRLYEQYVKKLEIQNTLLKNKVNEYQSQSGETSYEEDYDNVDKSIVLLKCMLKDMINIQKK